MERYELMNVIIMGVYTAVTAGMLIALACQISIARKSSHQELRAYVMGEMSSIINIADPLDVAEEDRTLAALKFPNNGPVAQMKIINAGKTPAYYVRHWGDMGFREYPLTGPLAEVGRTGMPMPIVLGPQISSTKLYRNIPPLTQAQIAQLRNGTGAIYVHGEITYKDAYGKSRYTRYRLIHNSLSGAVE